MIDDDDIEIAELLPDDDDQNLFAPPPKPEEVEPEVVKEIVVKDESITPEVVDGSVDAIEKDYKEAQQKLRDVLSVTKDSIDELVDLASSSAHPRVYEVLNGFLKTMESTSKSLVELHKQQAELRQKQGKEEDSESKNVTNNYAVFVGSTKELSDIIKNATKKT